MKNYITFVSFFITGNRGTHSNIYGEAFLRKKLAAKSRKLFLQKSSNIDFWLGSKYGSCRHCQKSSHLKDISPVT